MKITNFLTITLILSILLGFNFVSSMKSSSYIQYDYQGLDFEVQDQPIVDDQVMVKVNVHHPGFVAIFNQTSGLIGSLLGYSYTMEEVMSHNHSHPLFKISSSSNGDEDHTTYLRIPISKEGRTNTLYARLFNDTNMNKMFETDGTDIIVKDEHGTEVLESFIVTDAYPTTIKVYDQEVNLTNAQVYVDEVIVPGPAWLVIHINDSGSLGPMVGRRYIPLKQGVNSKLYVDINAYVFLQEEGEGLPSELAVFAHLHWDNKEYGIFNKTRDTHLFSPAFNDPIIGNESAKPFVITFKRQENVSGFKITAFIIGLLIIVTLFSRKRKCS